MSSKNIEKLDSDFDIIVKAIQKEYEVIKAIHTKKYNFSTIYYQKPDEDVLYVSSYRGKDVWSHGIIPKEHQIKSLFY